MTSEIFLKIKHHSDILIKLLPLFAFAAPLAVLYWLSLHDSYLGVSTRYSFELMWKGRTFQLFFIWLMALEFILSWENIKPKISKHNKTGLLAVAIVLLLPTLYVVSEYYFGVNSAIANAAVQNGVAFPYSMPLAVEYLVFSVLLCLTAFLYFGKKGLTGFALPALFVGLVGVIYTIDNFFPYGEFTPFQLLVPTTAMLAAGVLSLMGYGVLPGTENGMPNLQVTGSLGTAKFSIAWPCAGIESLLIFTAVALLFLQQMSISWKAKTGYFIVGAVVTYFINILRIVTIFIIAMNYPPLPPLYETSHEVQMFHFYYGPLYSIAWIVSYPLIVLASQGLWRKIKSGKSALTAENLGNLNQHS